MKLGRLYFAVQALAGALWWVGVWLSPFVRQVTIGQLDPVILAALDIPLFVVASALAAAGIRWAVWAATAWTVLVTGGMMAYATITTEAGWGALAMMAAAAGSIAAAALVLMGRIPTELVISGPFRFRLAMSSSLGYFARTLLQIAVFWTFFLGVLPVIISLVEQRWQLALSFAEPVRLAGVVVFVLASALGIWSAHTMSTLGDGTPLPAATANRLVVAGPYRFVRNPMAVSGIVQGAAVGLMLSSWLVVIYAVIGSAIWNWVVRPHEEADLLARFGDDYARYQAEVRCWIPRLGVFSTSRR